MLFIPVGVKTVVLLKKKNYSGQLFWDITAAFLKMKLYIFEKKDIKARGSSATERPGRRDPDDGAVWKASMLSFNPV